MKLSDFVFQFVAEQGVRHVFMLPGGGSMHMVNSLGRTEGVDYVCNLHEQASAIAAEAYARVTNNLGVALVTTGPGGTNAITGVAAAWQDSTPCLFISGQVKRPDMKGESGVRQLGVQEIDIVSIVSSITKYAVTITDPLTIRYHLEKAVYLARSGRPGPVWIDIPLDVQASNIELDNLVGFKIQDTRQSADEISFKDQVSQAIQLLNNAKRPVILAGNGIRLADALPDFLKLVDLLGIPVLTTRLGVDLIPASHELCFGMPGTIAARGSRAAKKVMVNIDHAEINKVKNIIDIPVCNDAGQFIREVISQSDHIKSRKHSAWQEQCQEWKVKYPFVLPEHYTGTAGISVYAFSDILSKELGEEHIVLPGNSGNACELFLTAFKAKAGQRVFHNKGTGAMGFCQPAAIGACLAGGKRPTVCVDGDGGFQLNIQELETVKRLGLPIKFFIMNNQGYGSIRSSQQGYFGQLTGADATSGLTLPDVIEVARAYGLNTARIPASTDLRKQINKVLNMTGPVVCEVMIIPDEVKAPRVSSFQKPDGSMGSKPLEDMWPFLDRKEFIANMMVEPIDL